MPGYMSFDQETSIQSEFVWVEPKTKKDKNGNTTKPIKKRVEGIHGGMAKDPRNDVYTMIYATHPDKVKLVHKKGGFKRLLPFRIRRVLGKSHTIIGANLKFDLSYIWHDPYFKKWLKKGGKIWDVSLVRYLLSAQRHQFPSLAELQKIYLGIKTKKDRISALFKKSIGANHIIAAKDRCPRLWRLYCEYGVEDGRTPMLIMQKQYKEAKAKGMLKVIEMYNEYLLGLTMIECNGLPINIEAAEDRLQEFTMTMLDYLGKAEEIVKKYWTDKRLPVLNLNSGQHKSVILFGGKIKVDVTRGTGEYVKTKSSPNYGKEKTKKFEEYVQVQGFQLPTHLTQELKTGYYATDEAVINRIYEKAKNEEAKLYCKHVKTSSGYKQKISTYLNAFVNRSVDGVLYPNYNNTRTTTGRLSASQPNVQNIPKHGEFYKLIQGLIKAPEGWTCVQIDFSQLEVYVRALLSGDTALINDLAMGRDFHCQNMSWGSGVTYPYCTYEEAVQWAKVEEIPEWKERRSQAKPISFGEAYGQMEESMADATGLPLEIVKKIYENMRITYPSIVSFEEAVVKQVQNSAVISMKEDIAEKSTRGTKDGAEVYRKYLGDVELVPIRQRDRVTYKFDNYELRHVGFYTSPTGRQYAFNEHCSLRKDGGYFRYYKPTQMKNYPMQGTAGDIQAITTVAMFQYLLSNEDKVKIVNEIHDSKWFLVKNEFISCIVPKLCAIMNNTSQLLKERFNIDVPFDFKCDAEVGPDFANLTAYKD